jgi:LysM repeat protein
MLLKKRWAVFVLGVSSLFLAGCASVDTPDDENPSASAVVANTTSTLDENAVPTATGVEYHIVKRGDTVFNIAKRYGRNVAQIVSWNKIKHNRIRLGQKLRVAAPVALPKLAPVPSTKTRKSKRR